MTSAPPGAELTVPALTHTWPPAPMDVIVPLAIA
jgi:hypothetical protein